MPQELLPFPPSYCLVGAYRLATDKLLWEPIWLHSRQTLKRCAIGALPFALISYPLTKLYVKLILSRSPFSPANIHDAAYLGISVVQYTTFVLVLGQLSALVEWALKKELRKARRAVYDDTVRSRGKPAEFWQPYVEEWAVPPLERARRSAEKQAWLSRLSTPIVRIIVLKVLLTPIAFIPGLSIAVSAALQCLTYARVMHRPYFEAKKMTPLEVELFVTERLKEYRMFGFAAACLERIPLIGLVFGVSNRIGAAMYAFDLEKTQHLYSSGELKPTRVYISKTAQLAAQGPPDLPSDFAGGFPTSKGPVRIEADGTEVGKPAGRSSAVPPPLPKRPAAGKEL